jgi:ABC-2 type transport system ATP-binding protein
MLHQTRSTKSKIGAVSSTTGALIAAGKRYSRRGRWVLDGVDLVVRPGERLIVRGDNGSGKTTLLRAIAGVTPLSRGAAIPARRVAYVPERAPAGLRLSSREYLGHMGKVRGMDRVTALRRGSEILERLRLEPDLEASLDSLSKGNRQKVLLAQAFLAPVDSIVLDEPFGGLDSGAIGVLEDLLVEAQDAGSALVISEHRPDVVTPQSRVLRIADGRIEPVAESVPAHRLREVAEVTLTGPPGGEAETLRTRPEVVEIAREEESTSVLLVRPDGVDALLRAVLDAGWSVISIVRRQDP